VPTEPPKKDKRKKGKEAVALTEEQNGSVESPSKNKQKVRKSFHELQQLNYANPVVRSSTVIMYKRVDL